MDIFQNQNESRLETNGRSFSVQRFFSDMYINRKPLREWGFEQSGLNRGDSIALKNHFECIKQGQVVDDSYTEVMERDRKTKVGADCTEKEKEKLGKEKDMAHLQETVIAAKETRVEEHNNEIQTKEKGMKEGTIKTGYNAARFWLYLTLCIFISLFILFFYASAINAAFFRSLQQMVNNTNGDDVTLMLNSIFDVNSIMNFGPQSVFTYLGSFIFFGFGILPHIFHHQKSKFSGLKIVAAILVCLAIDCLLAYKIDSGIHELKQMMGIADADWAWYKSVNFYLVLAFGFMTYIVWGIIYEAMLAEHKKKDVNACTAIEIKVIKRRIDKVNQQILEDKKKLTELQKQVEVLELEISRLKKIMEAAGLRPEELFRNLETFYSGWIGYLNGISENHSNKAACENVYQTFRKSLQQQLN